MTDNRNIDQKPESIALTDTELEKAAGGTDKDTVSVKIECRNCSYFQILTMSEKQYRMMKVTLAKQPCPGCRNRYSTSVTVV